MTYELRTGPATSIGPLPTTTVTAIAGMARRFPAPDGAAPARRGRVGR